VIDLRSDTATRPTAGMREAMARAEVGDEQRREDPTVNEFEARAAELLGQEEAVYLPTATMANQIALHVLGEPGDELIAEESSHVFIAEYGGPSVHSGLQARGLPGDGGRISPEQIRAAIRGREGYTMPTLVSIENTHNASGGRVWPLAEVEEVSLTCRELGLRLHLDGARLMNAAVATGVPASDFGRCADTVTLCFSKGLGCPLGAVVAGSAERMATARLLKHRFGGAMRQAGVVAAAAIYALDNHVDRLAEDHARARRLGEGLAAVGLPVELDRVETNFVQVDVAPLGIEKPEALARLREAGVGLSSTVHATLIRAVTHLDIADEDIDAALDAIPRALGALARA